MNIDSVKQSIPAPCCIVTCLPLHFICFQSLFLHTTLCVVKSHPLSLAMLCHMVVKCEYNHDTTIGKVIEFFSPKTGLQITIIFIVN